MPEFFELGIDKSAVSIVQRHGDAAAKKIAAEAVELLQAGDFHSYEVLKQILTEVVPPCWTVWRLV
jgi:triphosphoribosyl-dephospho-CoA synthetase